MDRINEENLADHFWQRRYELGNWLHLRWCQDPIIELRITFKQHITEIDRLPNTLVKLQEWTS